jgi:hypothetical protein
MVLEVLGPALLMGFSQILLQHKGKAGQSFDELILELGVENKLVACGGFKELICCYVSVVSSYGC